MAIVSVSLNEKILKEIDGLRESVGYAGRSEVIRSAVRRMVSEEREKEKLQGKIDGVILVLHDDAHTQEVSTVRHRHGGIIKTHVHSQLDSHKCLETFVVSGGSEEILEMEKSLKASRKLELVKLIVA